MGASQRAKRERFESESKEGAGNTTEREEIADLTMEDIALAIAMESLEDIDGILNRLNQPDSEDADIENLKSEMETLVDKAEQIEANLENIEHMENQEVQIVVNDYDEEEENEENSLDDEVRMITSDLGDRRGKGLAAFEPGRISDNLMKRFDSPTVNEELAVSRPKKKLISFDQVMRRAPSSSEGVRQQRDVELDEIRNVRKSWCPPDESELSFNKISKSATVPDRLKITSVYCNDKKEPLLVGKEERSQELLELRQSRSGDVRKAMKGDSSWVRETANHGGEQSRTQAELAALREARRDQVEELDQLYSTRQELKEQARLQRELEELRGNKGSTVRSIRKELEEINMGVAIREGEEREEVRKMFSDPSAHWQEERRRIQEAKAEKENTEAERPSAASWETVEPKFNNNIIPKEKKVEPVYSIPAKEKEKAVKHVHLEEEVEVIPIQSSDKSEKLVMETATEGGGSTEEVTVESKKSEGKIKEKLALLKKQTEVEVMRMKEKTSGLVNNLKEKQKEQTRGRSRKPKSEEEPAVEQPSLRSKSISTIGNAGVKMKELAQMAGEPIQKGRKRKL